MTYQLALIVVVFGVSLVLSIKATRNYIDKVRDELHTDAYEEGWSNGYNVGSQMADKRYDAGYDKGYKDGSEILKGSDLERGYAAVWDHGHAAKKVVKKPAKKAKKITDKGA